MRARAAATVGSSARAGAGAMNHPSRQGEKGNSPGSHGAISKTRHEGRLEGGCAGQGFLV